MSSTTTPPGWYPDPAQPGQLIRWWDGTQWTGHTQAPAQAQAPSYGAAGQYPPGYGTPGAYQTPGYGTGSMVPQRIPHTGAMSQSFGAGNRYTFITLGVVAIYVVINIAVHVAFIGILPVIMSVRALQRRERLAPIALIAAIGAVILAFATLAK